MDWLFLLDDKEKVIHEAELACSTDAQLNQAQGLNMDDVATQGWVTCGTCFPEGYPGVPSGDEGTPRETQGKLFTGHTESDPPPASEASPKRTSRRRKPKR